MENLSKTGALLTTLLALGLASCVKRGTTQQEARARYTQVPSEAYAVVADVRAKPGMEDELRDATLPLVARVRNEPNNRLYFLHEDREAPGYFIFYEIFTTRADFEAHNETPHVQGWFAQLSDLAEGGVTVRHMKILGNESEAPQ
jgi:quinol monooxygenase YgiN